MTAQEEKARGGKKKGEAGFHEKKSTEVIIQSRQTVDYKYQRDGLYQKRTLRNP